MLLCCVVSALALYIYSGVYTALIYIYIYTEQQFNARYNKAHSENEVRFNYSYYFYDTSFNGRPV